MRPTECKWCGCGVVHSSSDSHVKFTCRSGWIDGDLWACGPKCSDSMSDRIRRALEELKTATRFELVRDEYGSYMKGRDSYGNWLDVIEIEKVVKILEGGSNEIE